MSGMMIASPIGVAFDKSKGSMGNRVDCAKEHYGNNTNLATAIGYLETKI